MPSFLAVPSRMRWLAWWGTNQSMSSTLSPAASDEARMAAAMLVTACLKTSLPCIRSLPAVWVEDTPPSAYSMSCSPPVGEQPCVQHALVGIVAHPGMGLQHDRAGAVAEQHAGGAVAPVQQARHGLRPDQQDSARGAGPDQAVGQRQAIDEAGTDRLDVERRAACHAQPRLDDGGDGGEAFVRRGGGADDHVQLAGINPGVGQRLPGGAQGQVGGLFAFDRDVPLTDAGCARESIRRRCPHAWPDRHW